MSGNTWECFAKPAYLDGKACGHVNTGRLMSQLGMGTPFEYCAGCGCSRKASDDRRPKATT